MKIHLPKKDDLYTVAAMNAYDPATIPGAIPVEYLAQDSAYSEEGVEPDGWRDVGTEHREEPHWDRAEHPTAKTFYRKVPAYKYYVELDTLEEVRALMQEYLPERYFSGGSVLVLNEAGEFEIVDAGGFG